MRDVKLKTHGGSDVVPAREPSLVPCGPGEQAPPRPHDRPDEEAEAPRGRLPFPGANGEAEAASHLNGSVQILLPLPLGVRLNLSNLQ